MTELADDLLLLFERGGVVLWVILAIAASALGGWIGGRAAEAEAYI